MSTTRNETATQTGRPHNDDPGLPAQREQQQRPLTGAHCAEPQNRKNRKNRTGRTAQHSVHSVAHNPLHKAGREEQRWARPQRIRGGGGGMGVWVFLGHFIRASLYTAWGLDPRGVWVFRVGEWVCGFFHDVRATLMLGLPWSIK